jgi:Dolichyl-phosphate-mannose-protein mannosyltransferase
MSHSTTAPGVDLPQTTPEQPAQRWGRIPAVPTIIAIAAVMGTTALHAFAAWGAVGPVWASDEIGVLANARVIAGIGPPLELQYLGYYPGWSVVLAPLWWIFHDPGQIYRVAVALSALCGVLLIIPLTMIARRLGVAPPLAVTIAAIVAASPARTVMSNYALSENFLTLMIAVAVVVAIRFWKSRSPGWAAALGATVAYAFFSHGRAITLVAVTGVWFLTMIWRRPRAAVSGFVSLGVLSYCAFAINRMISGQLYGAASDRESSTLATLFKTTPVSFAQAALGQAWYLSAAWAGLVIIGAGTLAVWAAREVRQRSIGVSAWAIAALVAAAILSVGFVSSAIARGDNRLDLFIYGRYMDPFVAPVVLVGLVMVTRKLSRRTGLLLVAAAVVINGFFLTLSVPNIPKGGWWAPINIPGVLLRLWPTVGDKGPAPWLATGLVTVVFAICFLALRRWPALSMLAVVAYFAVGSVAADVRAVDTFNVGFNAEPELVATVQQLGPRHSLSFDSDRADPVAQNLYQYWFADRRVNVFDSIRERPATELVIARATWEKGAAEGALRVVAVKRGDALWVMPGALQRQLIEDGRVDPLNQSSSVVAAK